MTSGVANAIWVGTRCGSTVSFSSTDFDDGDSFSDFALNSAVGDVGRRVEKLAIADVRRELQRRRALQDAGIEADISCLKRAYGLARCTWRGLSHFKAYVWSSVVAYNLTLVARLAET